MASSSVITVVRAPSARQLNQEDIAMDTIQDRQRSIDLLNSLLRGEIAAVETYDQVIERYQDPSMPGLYENRASHHERIAVLRKRIDMLGGSPDAGSGAWGGFAKLIEGGATLFGRSAALAALEEGEEHGLNHYRSALGHLDAMSRALVEFELLPAQERSLGRLSYLHS
jgi:hypothetical protein